MSTLKDRINGAEQAAATEKSPIAALFHPQAVIPTETPASASSQRADLLDLPVDLMDEMEQPFRIYSGKKMEQMRESIAAHGIIQRVVVWENPERPGRYEIISGRHRRRGAILAGYTMVPSEIRHVDAAEARLQMLATNLDQRDELLPSEKAWAYREQMELLAHQGKRTDIEQFENASETLGENEEQTSGNDCQKWARDEIAAGSKDSARTIQNYIRLTYLTPELLEAVDAEKLGIVVGVTLSHLSADNQAAVYQYFFVDHKQAISSNLADTLRSAGEKGVLTEQMIQELLSPAKKAPKPLRKVSVPMKKIRDYFPAEATPKEIEKQIIEILTEYFKQKN